MKSNLQGTVTLKPRTVLGDDAPPPSMLKPIVDKVGVPLMWFGIGFAVALIWQSSKRS